MRRGRGKPRWETVEAFVAACLMYAKTHALAVPAEYVDISLWRVRYDYFTAVTKDARKPNASDRAALSAQLPRSPNGPAGLLDPQSGVVEFLGRVAELSDLLDWCADDAAGRMRLITGPGGIGKTRLALELAAKLKKMHWRCEWVGDRQEGHILADVRSVSQGPVLLVVDYAETRAGLEQLLRAVATSAGKIRLLLLARSAGQWWEQLGAGEGAIWDLVTQGTCDGIPLGEVLDEQISDQEHVLRVVPVFAAALGVSPPEHVTVVTQPRRARVLELHAAALVAVLEWILAPGLKPRVELGGVLNELLRHEERFWLGSALAQGLVYGPTGMTPAMLRQVVAAGCLLGAADQHEALALLGRVPAAPQSMRLAQWLRELYPPPRDSGEWLGMVQPDRLAERLVISQLGSSEELTQACLSDLGERQARRALLLLARAATEDDIAERLLRRLLPLVGQVIEDIDAPLETLVSIANAIPYPSMALGQAHGAITRRILDTPAARAHPSEYARWLTIRGLALTQLSRPWDALEVTEQAVEVYRELASANPSRYQHELAESLASLGIGLSEVGRAAEALAVTAEALASYQSLAAVNPDRYHAELAATLTNLGSRYSELGRQAEGLAVTEEAASLLHKLADANPDRYQAGLAATLTNLGARLSETGRHTEALPVTQEAVRIYQELVSANPDRYRPDHAATLAHLGARFSEVGRHAEALGATQDAASLLHEVAAADPERYRPDVAGFLASLAGQLLTLNRLEEALAAGQEALGIYRGLAVVNPDWYRPSLATALAKLGDILCVMRRLAEAVTAAQEAVGLYQQLASATPDRYRPGLAAALAKLGDILCAMRRPAEAVTVTQEAVELYRELAADCPQRYRSDLSLHLMVLGIRFSASDRPENALAAEREAIGLYRELTVKNPDWYRPNLALALMILGAQLSQLDRPVDALRPELEAISLYRELAADNPRQYRPSLAASLTSLGFRLSELDRPADALAATREAVAVFLEEDSGNPAARNAIGLYRTLPGALSSYRELAAADPAYRPDLALSLIGLVTRLSSAGGRAEALPAVQESVSLYRTLVASDAQWYQPNLALALMVLGTLHAELGHLAEALAAEQEAIILYRELAADWPDRYRPILAASLNSLGFRLSDLGRSSEALEVTREATRLYHEQARPQDKPLGASYPDSGSRLSGPEDPARELMAAQETVKLYRTLEAISPYGYRPALASALVGLGVQLLKADRLNTALSVQQEAVGIYRELDASDPHQYGSSLANALTCLADISAKLEDASGVSRLGRI